MGGRFPGIAVLAFLCAPPALAQSGPFHATPQRPTFTADTSTAAPGTLELESGLTFAKGFFGVPFNFKFVPEVSRGLLHRMEFSAGFRGVSSVSFAGGRITRFGESVAFVVRRPVFERTGFSFALAPRALFFTRDESGARLGLTAIAVYSSGHNGLVANYTWSGATRSSPNNAAGEHEIASDFSRTLGHSGVPGRLAVFGGVFWARPTGRDSIVALGQGISFRVRPNWVLDLAVREEGLGSGPRGYRILAGFTVNPGRIRDW